jgi:hypothetical protein
MSSRAIVAVARIADSYPALARRVSTGSRRRSAHAVDYIVRGNRALSDHRLWGVFVHQNDDEPMVRLCA